MPPLMFKFASKKAPVEVDVIVEVPLMLTFVAVSVFPEDEVSVPALKFIVFTTIVVAAGIVTVRPAVEMTAVSAAPGVFAGVPLPPVHPDQVAGAVQFPVATAVHVTEYAC